MKAILAAVALAALSASSASAAIYHFAGSMSGAQEAAPNASPGTGVFDVIWNDVAGTMRVKTTFADLIGTTTATHIHAATAVPNFGTAGVATQVPSFAGFPLGVTGGSYDHIFDMTLVSSWNPAYLTAHGGTTAQARVDLLAAMLAEKSYLNIHSSVFPGGEIRGFLSLVPEPGAWAMLVLGVGGVGAVLRRRRAENLVAA